MPKREKRAPGDIANCSFYPNAVCNRCLHIHHVLPLIALSCHYPLLFPQGNVRPRVQAVRDRIFVTGLSYEHGERSLEPIRLCGLCGLWGVRHMSTRVTQWVAATNPDSLHPLAIYLVSLGQCPRLVFCMYIHRTCIPDRANRYRARKGDIIISPQGFVTVKLREAAPGQSSASDSILHSDSIHIFLEHASFVALFFRCFAFCTMIRFFLFFFAIL